MMLDVVRRACVGTDGQGSRRRICSRLLTTQSDPCALPIAAVHPCPQDVLERLTCVRAPLSWAVLQPCTKTRKLPRSCPFLGRDIQTDRNVRGAPQALTRAIWKQVQHKP